MAVSAHPTPTAPLSLRPRRARLHSALGVFAAWTAYGVVHAAIWYATSLSPDPKENVGMWWVLPASLLIAWAWALATPLIFRLRRAVAPSRAGVVSRVLAHAAAAVAAMIVFGFLRRGLITLFVGQSPTGPLFGPVVFWSDVNLFTYLAVVFTGSAVDTHRRYLDRTLRAQILETQLARAQLHYLELQLQPHFLFNSLNAVQELAHESPRAAERMLHKLHTLLALSLARRGYDEVTLAEELAALEPYLDIQRTRFSDWLTVGIDADDVARGALVPHLILQPLVENAIRHGLAVRQGPGHIAISAERRGGRLRLTVRDNGVGLAAARRGSRIGIGITNARDRLRQLYGEDQSFELTDAPGGGALVVIEIPYRPSKGRIPDAGRHSSDEDDPELDVAAVTQWRTGEFAAPEILRPHPAEAEARAVAESSAQRPPDGNRGLTGERRSSQLAPPTLGVRAWGTFVVLWLGMIAFWTIQTFVFFVVLWKRQEMALLDPNNIKLQAVGSAYWILVSPLVFLAARRLRISPERWKLPALVHIAVGVVLAFGHVWATRLLSVSSVPVLDSFNVNPLTGNFFVYMGLIAWTHSRDFIAWYRAREVKAVELANEIAHSRFQALCMQIRPQFLLSTLELLSQLVHRDVWRAEHLIARMADVLRLTLDVARTRTTTLRQEMHLLSTFVEAHRIGIRPEVQVEFDIEPEAQSATVPSRLVCTMVDDLLAAETADPSAPLSISVYAERVADATRIRLHGDGAWRDAELHAWWRKKSLAEAAIADAGPLVSVTFPDRATAVVIVADPPLMESAEPEEAGREAA